MSQAKDKAKELVQEFYKWVATPDDRDIEFYKSKQCALICVDEMLKQPQTSDKQLNFLVQVKQEINKL